MFHLYLCKCSVDLYKAVYATLQINTGVKKGKPSKPFTYVRAAILYQKNIIKSTALLLCLLFPLPHPQLGCVEEELLLKGSSLFPLSQSAIK